jgi:mono/diheme cytochrome c family protein
MSPKTFRPFAGYVRVVIEQLVLFLSVPAVFLYAQTATRSRPDVEAGRQIYNSACVACHAADGTGTPKLVSGFEPPRTFPDFTKCNQTTPELNTAWKDVILHGGPARGFSQIMPSFGEALTSEQIDDVIEYVRSFCRNPHWPRGELNLPLAFATEKAFPEDEVVIRSALNAQGAPGVTNEIVYEQRFGVKNQIEVAVPLLFQDQNHTWYGGVGDVVLGLKRNIFSNLRSGSILSVQGEVIAPTGNKFRGFGTGTTTFGIFTTFGQLFPRHTFVQFQGGADLPVHTNIAPQSVFWHTAVGQSFAGNHGLGRLWSPMVEFLADRELTTGAKTKWDVLPEMQVTLNRRQNIRANLGVRVPANNTAGRSIQVVFYLLWDWADGRLNEGW